MPQFSDAPTKTPIRTDAEGVALIPEWSDEDLDKPPDGNGTTKTARVRTPKALQPDATQMDSITQATEWLAAHPAEAAMLRAAQIGSAGDILAASGVRRHYSSPEAAAFFDKSVQWLYWGMRHPPHGGRLFIEPVPVLDEKGKPVLDPETGLPVYEVERDEHGNAKIDETGKPVLVMVDIPVPRLDNNPKGKRLFYIPIIRKFAISAYHQHNIKEPKLRAVLERLAVAERGGNWKAIPIPARKDDEEDDGAEPN